MGILLGARVLCAYPFKEGHCVGNRNISRGAEGLSYGRQGATF